MAGNVVRIGDKVTCGDNVAQGSGTVFANGMPVTHEGRRATTGHGCFTPTVLLGPWTSTVFVNNQPVALKDVTRIQPHRCRKKKAHDGVATTGSPNVYFEA